MYFQINPPADFRFLLQHSIILDGTMSRRLAASLAPKYSVVVICVADAASARVAESLKNRGIPVVVISVLAPVPAMNLAKWADTVLMAYSYSPYSFNAVFGALAGEFTVRGVFPLAE